MLSNNQKKNKYYINRSRLARKFEQNQQNKEDKIVFFSKKKEKEKLVSNYIFPRKNMDFCNRKFKPEFKQC